MDRYLEFFSSTAGIGVGVVGWILVSIGLMAIARRARTGSEWMAWVPFLNLVLMVKAADKELWWVVLCLIPCVNLFALPFIWWKIAEKMGKPGPIGLLVIVPCVNLLVPLYLGFSE